jgi:hypothetical protein
VVSSTASQSVVQVATDTSNCVFKFVFKYCIASNTTFDSKVSWMFDSAIIKYSCQLMNRRTEIGYTAINEHRQISDAEKIELKWIGIKMQLIRQVQLLRR